MDESTKDAGRRATTIATTIAMVLGLLSIAATASAAPPLLYHSPADDGAFGTVPAQVPFGQPVTLHLYLDPGTVSSAAQPCLGGEGHEVCGFLVKLLGAGMALESFTPADADTLFNLSSPDLAFTGGDFVDGDLGPTKLGDLVIEGPSAGGTLSLVSGGVVTADLTKATLPPRTIVALPEPRGPLLVALGATLLFACARRDRRRSGVTRRAVGSIVSTSFGASLAIALAVFALIAGGPAAAQVPFPPLPSASVSSVSSGTEALAQGDFDEDGQVDLVTANGTSNDLSLLLGNGDGSFAPAVSLPAGTRPIDVQVRDLDGDGHLDLVTANDTASAGVSVFLGNGDGTFQSGVDYAVPVFGTPARLSDFALEDVDGNGTLDVAALSFLFSGSIAFLLGVGDGTFTPGPSFLALGASAIATDDFDGNATVDLVVVGFGGVQVFPGNGDATFGSPITISTAIASFVGASVAAGDLDGDGHADFVVVGSDASAVVLGNGDGTFAPATALEGGEARPVVLADLDASGSLDILLPVFAGFGVRFGLGDGSFAEPVPYTLANQNMPLVAIPADLVGDAVVDLAVGGPSGRVYTVKGTGGGRFAATTGLFTLGGPGSGFLQQGFQATEIDGDGVVDLLGTSTALGAEALVGNGDGSFTRLAAAAPPTNLLFPFVATRVDADLVVDLLAVVGSGSSVVTRIGIGNGTFGPEITASLGSSPVAKFVTNDFDGDGRADVAAVTSLLRLLVFTGNGDGTFAQTADLDFDGSSSNFVPLFTGDVDADGHPDLAYLRDLAPDTLTVRLGNGDGTFGSPLVRSLPEASQGTLALADFDGDGHPDFAYQSLAGIYTLAGNGDGTFQAAVQQEGPASANFFRHLATGDFDLDGAPDLVFLRDSFAGDPALAGIYLRLGNGDGTFAPAVQVTEFNLGSGALPEFSRVLAVDLDGNGAPDLASATNDGLVIGLLNLSPPDTDEDGDGLLRLEELAAGTDPLDPDTDDDGLLDGFEVLNGLDPLTPDPTGLDADGDGLTTLEEQAAGTLPFVADSDGDGVNDGDEVNVLGTDPLDVDSDDDGLVDGQEVTLATDPLDPDTDGDALADGLEVVTLGTDPLDVDTDGDGLDDGREVNLYGTNPLVGGDSDGDGLSDAEEVARGTNPNTRDTDGDGFDDDVDNCPSAFNPEQLDAAGFGTGVADGVGDLCQNGDFNRDGATDLLDATLIRRGLIDLEPALDPALPPSTP
ncbi:MAG: FG-GAP-like repeat-containing protein [Myxococcota bacterium]